MNRSFFTRVCVVLVAVLLLPALAFAQAGQVGQLGGEVKDATGGALPGASVVLVSVERGFSRASVTDANGRFLFTVVPLGRYTVTVKLPNFETVTLANNLVEAERSTTVVSNRWPQPRSRHSCLCPYLPSIRPE